MSQGCGRLKGQRGAATGRHVHNAGGSHMRSIHTQSTRPPAPFTHRLRCGSFRFRFVSMPVPGVWVLGLAASFSLFIICLLSFVCWIFIRLLSSWWRVKEGVAIARCLSLSHLPEVSSIRIIFDKAFRQMKFKWLHIRCQNTTRPHHHLRMPIFLHCSLLTGHWTLVTGFRFSSSSFWSFSFAHYAASY